MSKIGALELMPFLILIAAVALVFSTTAATSAFSFPDIFSRFSFGDMASYQPGTTTTMQKAALPLADLSQQSGIAVPFGGFSTFGSPYTSENSYVRTLMTPDGPVTQRVDEIYDGSTGERTTTVTNL